MGALRRKAFIIGAEQLQGQDRLPGVRRDKERVLELLRSDNGGAWERGEIDVLERPYVHSLAETQARPFDYVFFYFAGHGYTTDDGDTVLCINENQSVALSNLWLPAARQLMVIDACRTVLREREVIPRRIEKVAQLARMRPYRACCRALFDQVIMQAEKGRIIMFASAQDEAAGESAVRGGDFTYNLVTGICDWVDKDNGIGRAPSVLTCREAFRLADARMDHQFQNPVFLPGRRQYHFPVAVLP